MDHGDETYDRLRRLVTGGDGDHAAATELLTEARRRDDRDGEQVAAAALGHTRAGGRRSYSLKRTSALRRTAPAWERELNVQQREVVLAGAGAMLVIAGAGSGKTRTLTYRVARLIDLGVAPERILLLTFTNRAAREMVRRVSALVEGHAERIQGGTFHHIGHRILRRHAAKLGYTTSFAIMDGEDCATLMGACVAELGMTNRKRRFPRGNVLQRMLSMAINTGCSLEDVVEARYDQFRQLVGDIGLVCQRYIARKREMDLMDYDDLLLNWRRLMVEHPEVGRDIADGFEHVLVDEYQDSNSLQGELVDRCAAVHGNVMVVGDDCQSIYSFRGANFENILRFPERYPDCRVFKLEINYRSTPQILDLANRSITFNQRRFDKLLRPVRPGGVLPALVPAREPVQQAQFIAERILELAETGVPLGQIAVLYRAHYQSVEVQLELTRADIPFTVRSGTRFFEQAHVKDVLAFLRFVFNPRDELSFHRLVTRVRGVGDRSASAVWDALRESDDPLALLADPPAELLGLLPRRASREAFARTARLLTALTDASLRHAPGELVGRVVDFEDYADHVRSTYRNADNRLADLEQMARYAAQFDDVEAFLGELALLSGISGEDIVEGAERDEKVVLTSVHQAKGLEWPIVFVSSLWDGGFPTGSGQQTAAAEEEERRLFYVAVTRAMDELYLTYPLSRRERGGHHRVLRASPFVSELYEPGVPPRSHLLEEWALSES